jgi:hypothetical protein
MYDGVCGGGEGGGSYQGEDKVGRMKGSGRGLTFDDFLIEKKTGNK